ncbi:S-adenosyl-L-methionine-dependent methyltransferase [Hypomontagnella monticulosa]|nr:S-adenosyl-L-methionine-dependent methyltransferase [Hypomontagnella monticulosa]
MDGHQARPFPGEAYKRQGEVYFNDGRENELLHFIHEHSLFMDMQGNPQKVLDAIDEYGRTQKYLMNIGEYKSKTIIDLIKKEKPQIMVELGGYVGYSAIAFGMALRDAGGKRYFSLEMNSEFAAIIRELVALAGLDNIVEVVVGSSSDSLRRLCEGGKLKHIDLLFLDHYKPAYTTDLKLLVKPGNPLYLEYVRSSSQEKKRRLSNGHKFGPCGNPNLIYESRFVEGWEPSGVPASDAVEITKCTGIEV